MLNKISKQWKSANKLWSALKYWLKKSVLLFIIVLQVFAIFWKFILARVYLFERKNDPSVDLTWVSRASKMKQVIALWNQQSIKYWPQKCIHNFHHIALKSTRSSHIIANLVDYNVEDKVHYLHHIRKTHPENRVRKLNYAINRNVVACCCLSVGSISLFGWYFLCKHCRNFNLVQREELSFHWSIYTRFDPTLQSVWNWGGSDSFFFFFSDEASQ